MDNYACTHCGYDEGNKGYYCNLGCGRDYNEMVKIPDSVVRQIKNLEEVLSGDFTFTSPPPKVVARYKMVRIPESDSPASPDQD